MFSPFTTVICAATMPPTSIIATQDDTNITVNWTPPDPTPSGYMIHYSTTGDEGSVSVSSGSASRAVITGRQADRVYTVTIVALSTHLPSVPTTVPAIREGMTAV